VISSIYFNGPRDTAIWLYRHHGLLGFYRGFTVFALRDVPTFGAYVVCYEALFRKLAAHRFAYVDCTKMIFVNNPGTQILNSEIYVAPDYSVLLFKNGSNTKHGSQVNFFILLLIYWQ